MLLVRYIFVLHSVYFRETNDTAFLINYLIYRSSCAIVILQKYYDSRNTTDKVEEVIL